MRESEILKKIEEQRNESHCIVKWWRKEDDFVDYDLIERFVENGTGEQEIGGISLLTMDDMWSELQRIAGARLKFEHNATGDTVTWEHKGKNGTQKQVCAYIPETLMTIFDVETKGNPLG
jgi:hypothetical protein